jgi:hypothetical protein
MSTITRFMSTMVGSMPHDDAEAAVDIILSNIMDAPAWPQLPKTGLHEQMEIQYSEGMPRVVIDEEKNRMFFDTSGDYSEAFAEFYESYIMAMDPDEGNGDCSSMVIGSAFAKGLYELELRLKGSEKRFPFIKVQTTGPCTVALSTVDENKRAIYYNEEFRDVVVKALAMKCRWQIQKFAPYADSIICFIDEPILSAFGSSTYVSVKREDIVEQLTEVIEAIHADNGLAGVHCCGNTEWSILVDAGVDILNLDAYEFGESIAIYPDAVRELFERGGRIAWGIVPTSEAIRSETVESLAQKLDHVIDNLASKGIDREQILDHSMVTPSCGTGSMDPKDAESVFRITGELSDFLKSKYA